MFEGEHFQGEISTVLGKTWGHFFFREASFKLHFFRASFWKTFFFFENVLR